LALFKVYEAKDLFTNKSLKQISDVGKQCAGTYWTDAVSTAFNAWDNAVKFGKSSLDFAAGILG